MPAILRQVYPDFSEFKYLEPIFLQLQFQLFDVNRKRTITSSLWQHVLGCHRHNKQL